MADEVILGLDVGGTKIAAALVGPDGGIIKETRETTCSGDFSSFLLPLRRAVNYLLEFSCSKELEVTGIGLAIAGMVNFEKQRVIFSPNLPLRNVAIRGILEEEFNVPALIDNDANCAVWGEKIFGAGRGRRNLVCITVGTGIGGGVVIDGKLYRGATGAAGEIGHMIIDPKGPPCGCGSFGCLEALASANALVGKAVSGVPADSLVLKIAGGDKRNISGETITEAAAAGDSFAQDILADTGRIIGAGLSNLVNIFDPEQIIVSGGFGTAPEFGRFVLRFAEEKVLSRAMAMDSREVEIVTGVLGQKAGIVGAAALARDELGL